MTAIATVNVVIDDRDGHPSSDRVIGGHVERRDIRSPHRDPTAILMAASNGPLPSLRSASASTSYLRPGLAGLT
jgi:hypothetical protein